MLRDITMGQYYPVDSFVHRLDPRTKLAWTFVYVTSLFFIRNIRLFAVALALLALETLLSRVPIRFMLKGMKPVIFVLLVTVVLTLFTVTGTTVLWEWRFLRITETGLYTAVYLGLRLCLMVPSSCLLTYTTTPTAITDGLEKLLGWMNHLRVPVHELAMIMSLALRFIPVLTQELDRLMKAQMARGIDFQEGRLTERVKKLTALVIPLFVSAIRRSDELAMAMDARCYHGGEGRTHLKPLRYRGRDRVLHLLTVFYLAGMLVLAVKMQ